MGCPYADRQVGDRSLRCTILKEERARWDLCIHQYFCRTKGLFRMNAEAANCKIRKKRK